MIKNKIRHQFSEDFVFRHTGICIHPEYPFIAASPDGVLFNATQSYVVEVKTVFTGKKMTLQEIIEKRSPLFCLEIDEMNQITMNKKHTYFTQIQIQMFCSNVHKCLFVLFHDYNEPLFQQEIDYDPSFVKSIFPVLSQFYFGHFLPALSAYK